MASLKDAAGPHSPHPFFFSEVPFMRLSESETLKLLSEIEEALQWWEIKGSNNRDWVDVARAVQEAMSRSEFCTIENPYGKGGCDKPKPYVPADQRGLII
jgi:hypothetical protein